MLKFQCLHRGLRALERLPSVPCHVGLSAAHNTMGFQREHAEGEVGRWKVTGGTAFTTQSLRKR